MSAESSTEVLERRVRSAGFGLVDGSGFLVVAAILAQFTPSTRNRALEEVSP